MNQPGRRVVQSPTSDLGTATWMPAFDGLRAIAATLVLLHHASFVTGFSFTNALGPVFERADSGVQVFFLISAFLLYFPLVTRRVSGEPDEALVSFWLRRVVRIYPAYWVALAGISIFFGLSFASGREILSLSSLTQIYSLQFFNKGISQSWSLATELGFYLFLPFWAFFAKKLWSTTSVLVGVRRELVGLACLVLISYTVRLMSYSGIIFNRRLVGYWTIANLDLFASGMALAILAAVGPQLWGAGRRGVNARFSAGLMWIASRTWLCFVIAAAFYLVASEFASLPVGFEGFSTRDELVRQFLYWGFGFFLVLPVAIGRPGGALKSILSCRPLVFFGSVSYGVYLWHQAILGKLVPPPDVFQASNWFWQTTSAGSGRLGFVPVVFFALIGAGLVGWLSSTLVEEPLRQWASRKTRSWRQRLK